ncbi:unnamed protein product, partial [Meganyctiphanes norvegica]
MKALKEFTKNDACLFLKKHQYKYYLAASEFVKAFDLNENVFGKIKSLFQKKLTMARIVNQKNQAKKKKYDQIILDSPFYLDNDCEDNVIDADSNKEDEVQIHNKNNKTPSNYFEEECDEILEKIKEVSEKYSKTSECIVSYIVHKIKHTEKCNNLVSKVKCNFNKCNTKGSFGVNLEKALYIKNNLRLSKDTYINLRIMTTDSFQFPSYDIITKLRKEITPTFYHLSYPSPGIKFSYRDAMQMHLQRLQVDISLEPVTYALFVKDGLDGSGSHPVYHQFNPGASSHKKTGKTLITYGFVPYRLVNLEKGLTVWEEKSPNSPEACRPLFIMETKEERNILKKLIPPVQDEITDLKVNGIHIDLGHNKAIVYCHITMSMVDGKMQDLLLGTGGSFCNVCKVSKADSQNLEIIEQGFQMDRSIEFLTNIWDSQNINGEMKSRKGDYCIRFGLTQKPISKFDIKTVPVLHCWLRGFAWAVKFISHVAAGVNNWTNLSDHETSKVGLAKAKLQTIIFKETGIRLDAPGTQTCATGTSTTGNVAKRLLNYQLRPKMVIMIQKKTNRENAVKVLRDINIILRVISSSKKVDFDKVLNIILSMCV